MLLCERPDRDVSAIVCAHPLPCPWHTVTFHTDRDPPTVEIPATAAPLIDRKMVRKLKDVVLAIRGGK